MQELVHYSLHFLLPVAIAFTFFNENWKKALVLLWLTMLIDADHLLATPLFDPNRCSIGFHPLHTMYVVPVYVAMLFLKKTRVVGIGLVLHLITDGIDCLWMKW